MKTLSTNVLLFVQVFFCDQGFQRSFHSPLMENVGLIVFHHQGRSWGAHREMWYTSRGKPFFLEATVFLVKIEKRSHLLVRVTRSAKTTRRPNYGPINSQNVSTERFCWCLVIRHELSKAHVREMSYSRSQMKTELTTPNINLTLWQSMAWERKKETDMYLESFMHQVYC